MILKQLIFSKVTLFSLLSVVAMNSTVATADDNTPGQHKPVIAIHGGAGTITRANLSEQAELRYREALRSAVSTGYSLLQQGKSSEEAVIAAIMQLEDSPLFNAGKGAVYTYDERHELDASIMRGQDRAAGAVAGITNVKNPILAAQAVMNHSVHVMLSGRGAETFASSQGLELVDNSYFNTESRFDALKRAKQKLQRDTSAWQQPSMLQYKFGTVGAVALDKHGNLAAGTSTGGMTAKRFGRIGDSPVIGAGTFADNDSCAVSATGHGEYFIRYNVAADVCARMAYSGKSLQESAHAVIHDTLLAAGGYGGIIAVSAKGEVAMPFNTEGMYRASVDQDGKIVVAIYGE